VRCAALLAPLALLACSRPAPVAPIAPSGPPPASSPAAEPPPIPVAADGRAWVITASALRREPTDAAKVAAAGGKPSQNVLAVLMRGEPVTLLEGRGEWARVRTSADEPGWVRRAGLLEQEAVGVATALQPADVFDRPDLLAVSPGRRLAPGTILLVVRQKPPFAEVNAGAPPTAWVLADRLAGGEREVATAKLCEKARWLKRSGKEEEARQVLALGRSAYPGAPLLDVLGAELGEPAAVAPGAPTGAPGAPPAPLTPAAAPAPPPGPPAAAPPG
jgi:SH3-like domain-containing protein